MPKHTLNSFTEKQLWMLELIHDRTLQLHGDKYLYVETGQCKPWNISTPRSLERKNLVTIEYRMPGVYYVYPTELGAEVAKQVFEKKYPHTVVEG